MRSVLGLVALCAGAMALDNGLGATPDMGWNSWNHYGCGVNETLMVRAIAAIHATGLQNAGYVYTCVDDCWAGWRDSQGNIQPDNTTFPHGLSYLASYAHSVGQKFGTYTCAGTKTCAGRPGSYGYEVNDANSYASWGIDYAKVDWCYTSGLTPEDRYPVFAAAWNQTGRPIYFAACEWGVDNPATWMPPYANNWRTTTDIQDNWNSILANTDNNEGLYLYAGPGGWNQPDMLEVGNGGCSATQYTSHFSLWAMMKAPLLIGCDVTNMDAATFEILTNVEVIAVDQDALGVQGRRVWSQGTPVEGGVRKHPGYALQDTALLQAVSDLGATNVVAVQCDATSQWQQWQLNSTDGNIHELADGRCLDIDCCNNATDELNNVSAYPCHDAAPAADADAREWADWRRSVARNGPLVAKKRRAIRAALGCDSCGDSNQQWTVNADGTITTALDGQCLTAAATNTAVNARARKLGAFGYNVGTAACQKDASGNPVPWQTWTAGPNGTVVSGAPGNPCLAVFQDVPAGAQEVWAIPLANGDVAVLLFNRAGTTNVSITANWADIGLPAGTTVSVRDLWNHADLPYATDSVSATVVPYGVAMYRLSPQ